MTYLRCGRRGWAVFAAAMAASSIFCAGRANGVARTWTGGATGTGTAWSVASNWNPATLPGAGDDAIVPFITSLSDTLVNYDYAGAAVTLNSLTLNHNNASNAFTQSSVLTMSA